MNKETKENYLQIIVEMRRQYNETQSIDEKMEAVSIVRSIIRIFDRHGYKFDIIHDEFWFQVIKGYDKTRKN